MTVERNPDFALMVVSNEWQAEAQYELREGRYSVGRSLECDIILLDDAVADQHATFEFEGGRIQVLKQNAPIEWNGSEMETDCAELQDDATIVLGKTRIGFSFPSSPEPANEDYVHEGDPAANSTPERRGNRRNGAIVAGAVLGLSVAALLLMGLTPQDYDEPAGLVVEQPVEPREKLQDKQPELVEERKAILLDGVREIVAGLGYELSANREADGSIALTGIVPDTAARERLLQVLKADLPDGEDVSLAGVTTIAGLKARLDKALIMGGLSSHVTSRIENGRLIVDGVIAASMLPQWEEIRAAQFDPLSKTFDPVVNVHAQKKPGITIHAIWAGDTPYAILSDSQIYTEGAILEGGWVIEDINADGIRLSRQGLTTHLRLNG